MDLNKSSAYTLISLLEGATNSAEIIKRMPGVELRTTQRALERLSDLELVESTGPSNAPKYSVNYQTLLTYNVAEKFLTDENRPESSYNFALVDWLNSCASSELTKIIGTKIPKSPQKMSQRDVEHLTIELSWKSSALEGNTYTLLDTNLLLTEGVRPKNRTDFETQMIINHKDAIEFIMQNTEAFSGKIAFKTVVQLHRIIGKNLGIDAGVRKRVVKISASNYTPPTTPSILREQADKILTIISNQDQPFTKALLALALMPYLQTFEDGNKRTGRLLANAILISTVGQGFSLRKVEARDLALAYLQFYEFNSMHNLRQILSSQLNDGGGLDS